MKKYLIVAGIIAFAIPGLMAAQTTSTSTSAAIATSTLPAAGITPDSPFYFLKSWGESFREFFTFGSEARARLQIEFAKQRAAEVKALIEKKGVDAPGLSVAEKNLQTNLTKAGDIVNNLKSQGQDVSGLANELDNNIEESKSVLAETFREKVKNLDETKSEIQKEINNAIKSDATSTLEALRQKFADFQSKKINLEQKQTQIENDVNSEQEHIQDGLGLQVAAEKAISRASDGKISIINKTQSLGVTIPSDVLAKFDALLSQAKAAYDAKNYEKARELAQEAWQSLAQESGIKDVFEKAREALKEQMQTKLEKQDRRDNATSSDSSKGFLEKLKENFNGLYELKPQNKLNELNQLNSTGTESDSEKADGVEKVEPAEPAAPVQSNSAQ